MALSTAGILTDTLERAAGAHGVYEAEVLGGVHDVGWPRWYAEHMTRTLTGEGYRLAAEVNRCADANSPQSPSP
jgi:hypothetical protein